MALAQRYACQGLLKERIDSDVKHCLGFCLRRLLRDFVPHSTCIVFGATAIARDVRGLRCHSQAAGEELLAVTINTIGQRRSAIRMPLWISNVTTPAPAAGIT